MCSISVRALLPSLSRRSVYTLLYIRKFKVRLSYTLCEEFEQEAGVPQGGVLSTTLFILKINSITNYLAHDIENFLYVPCSKKKGDTKLMAVTLSFLNRFSKFFH